MQKWQSIRLKGKRNFILIRGVIGWGGMTAALWLIFSQISGSPLPISIIVAGIIFLPAAGGIWGWMVWNSSERQFKHYQEKQKE